VPNNASRWKVGFKIETPEFQGCLQLEEFRDRVAIVEEILDFKEVPRDRRVPLVTTKLRGKAVVWCQCGKGRPRSIVGRNH
jgi:hypothetical protein